MITINKFIEHSVNNFEIYSQCSHLVDWNASMEQMDLSNVTMEVTFIYVVI